MKKLLNNKGLTLVEIIITLSVLGIVIVPLMSMFITSQKINNESDMKYHAIQLAQEHIESIKAMEPTLDTVEYPSTGVEGKYSKTITTSDDYQLIIKIEKDSSIVHSEVSMTSVPTSYDKEVAVNDASTITIDVAGERTIKVQLNVDNGKIDIKNGNDSLKLYFFKSDINFKYTITGNATVIEVEDDMDIPDNFLYNITVDVLKGSKLIDTIKGTTVFTSEPT